MKKMILLATLVGSFSAMACPNIAATYNCSSSQGENYDMKIEQGSDAGGEYIITDADSSEPDKLYLDGDQHESGEFTYRASCEGNKIAFKMGYANYDFSGEFEKVSGGLNAKFEMGGEKASATCKKK